ncbi:putative CHCH domain protein [Toxoplasma gondii TgCatPRC2]|uniref:COX assembly mitochondrial protein n=15 Tax=Toxoplasma gondii TaxID=5811 RepID=B9PH34_TOXGV|nr:hypothetical protein TGME49_268740 [Toxoplasma gondii ME49]EPR64855.1 hypothetical protein TGGT1_268740 [Toxoplasma gondii GT1]ESS36325.1 putative CHCH domain protein [Toxoplasma gondii VEG]KAF4642437.1 hypothetical protein TGRH88_082520 [Toxoplasma gondii]KFG39164.1 putative CHCH domain protein [Toxoplasma gondii GAB2-2007-GAL-DOM2]KFG52480.1 putative CHCH domain protein [Toxoplasma gondii p89]KFG54567.1 putative CHCH domain protein [Toxoplasma gondii FOU]KFG61408.1 putative CHCH domain |eukprot:XP_002365567.1 hypothetical protein TGME49_268740 [Toxoplasma gondii ME49]
MPAFNGASREEPGRFPHSDAVKSSADSSSAPPSPSPKEGSWIPGTVLHPDDIHQSTRRRIEYFEAKQATHYEKKENDAIRKQIGKEIRDKCRPELDEYYDCMCDRTFTFIACRRYAEAVQKCVKKYEEPEAMNKRWEEVAQEREALGLSRINRRQRKYYNKYITDLDGSGWLPKPKTEVPGSGNKEE